jgi:hypothetical protein
MLVFNPSETIRGGKKFVNVFVLKVNLVMGKVVG